MWVLQLQWVQCCQLGKVWLLLLWQRALESLPLKTVVSTSVLRNIESRTIHLKQGRLWQRQEHPMKQWHQQACRSKVFKRKGEKFMSSHMLKHKKEKSLGIVKEHRITSTFTQCKVFPLYPRCARVLVCASPTKIHFKTLTLPCQQRKC